MAPVLSKSMEAFSQASAAAVGGCVSTFTLYPLDTLKTRMQSKVKDDDDTEKKPPLTIKTLYQGVGSKMSESAMAKFLYFYNYTILCTSVLKLTGNTEMSTLWGLVTGYVAEGMHLPLTLPMEVIATKLQTKDDSKKSSLCDVVKDIAAEGNGSLSGFYKGWKAYLVLCCQPAIQYTIFEQLKKLRIGNRKASALSLLESFVLGAIARSIATLIVYPYIRAKVVCQTARTKAGDSAPSVLNTITTIIKENGFSALYKGIVPELSRGALSSALMLMVKERIALYNRKLLISLSAKKVSSPAAANY